MQGPTFRDSCFPALLLIILKKLDNFCTRSLHFHFAPGPANFVGSPHLISLSPQSRQGVISICTTDENLWVPPA